MTERFLHGLLGLMLAVVALTTPSTSNVPGGQVWEWVGMVSAIGWFIYAAQPTRMVASIAVAAFLVQSVPRGLAWAHEMVWAPAAIWGGWTVTMVLVWRYRPRTREN